MSLEQVCHLLTFPFHYALLFLYLWIINRASPNMGWTNGQHKNVLGFTSNKLNCTMSIKILQLQNKNYGLTMHNFDRFKRSMITNWSSTSLGYLRSLLQTISALKSQLCFWFLSEPICFQCFPLHVLAIRQLSKDLIFILVWTLLFPISSIAHYCNVAKLWFSFLFKPFLFLISSIAHYCNSTKF